MRPPRTSTVGPLVDERGAALVLTLMVLLILSGLVLALLAASSFEPQISRNHSHTVRTRYVAEAGLEYAYDVLATDVGGWNGYLTAATCNRGAVLGAADSTLAGLASVHGSFTVTVRNDCNTGDAALTGVSLDTSPGACDPDTGGAGRDANCRVIVTSTGTLGGMTRAITAVVMRTLLPAINAALAFPGVQADVSLGGSGLSIDGRDNTMADRPGTPTGGAAPVYGISVNGSLPALESQVESELARGAGADIRGKDENDGSVTTSGTGTVRSDAALTTQAVLDFVAAVTQNADVAVHVSPGGTHAVADLGSACASNPRSDRCWGTTSSPKIVHVSGAPTDASGISLRIDGNSTGAGILIIENGAAEIGGSFRWSGLVIATGRNVGIRYLGSGQQQIYGATIVNELNAGAAASFTTGVLGNGALLYSRQALEMVQNGLSRRLVTVYHWADQ